MTGARCPGRLVASALALLLGFAPGGCGANKAASGTSGNGASGGGTTGVGDGDAGSQTTSGGSVNQAGSPDTAGAGGDGSSADTAGAGGEVGAAVFVHPGLLHTEADFERMRAKVSAGASPWIDGWKRLTANRHASLSWVPNPQTEIHRNDGMNPDNSQIFANDVAAAYACALRWKVSGDAAYADKAVEIMNAWSAVLTQITWSDGHYDGLLAAAFQGYQFANAAEMLRGYSGWADADWQRFKRMMVDVFIPRVNGYTSATPSSLLVYSNWDLGAMAAGLAIAVLIDDHTLFDSTIEYFKTGLGNGGIPRVVNYIHPGYWGQTQESGRDQGHNTLSIMALSTLAEMAWNQGVDLYGYDNNRILAGCEYVARGNLIETGTAYYAMPFSPYTNGSVKDSVFATGSQGAVRPEWTLILNHYVNRLGLSAPFTQRFVALTSPEGGGGDYGPNSGGYDQLGYGTLTFTRDPIVKGAAPSGLTAYTSQGDVVLSWWGSAYASSYSVKQSSTPGGPYATIANDIVEPRTFTDHTASSGAHYYVVTAQTPSGETEISNEARAYGATELHTLLTFDDGSGTTAADDAGNAHTGMLSSGVTWQAGKKGSSAAFDGTSGYVSLPKDVLADLADFTVVTWVYWTGAAANQRIFDFGTGLGEYMFLTPRNGAGHLRFAATTSLGAGEQAIETDAALPSGQWVQVALTLSGTTGTLYVNGKSVGTNADLRLAPFRLGHTTQNWLGRSQYPNDPYFKGQIDDFRIYYGALSAEQISAL